MRKDKVHDYLMDWAQDMLKEMDSIFSSKSPIYVMMMGQGGIHSDSYYSPTDWTYWKLGLVNTQVMVLTTPHRNAITAKYLIGLKGTKFWKELDMSRSGAYRVLDEAMNEIGGNLDNLLGRNYHGKGSVKK